MTLKEYLASKGEKQTDFAIRVQTTVSTISRISAGLIRPALDLALRIERATGGKVRVEQWENPVEQDSAA